MNVATCQVVSYCTVLLYLAILMRIMFGPFTYAGVVALHYWTRLTILCFFSMLTFKTVLKTLFILDFPKMTSIPEQTVMMWMWVVTSICAMAHLVQEAVLRHALGIHHFGRMCFYIYMGKVRQNCWILVQAIVNTDFSYSFFHPLRGYTQEVDFLRVLIF